MRQSRIIRVISTIVAVLNNFTPINVILIGTPDKTNMTFKKPEQGQDPEQGQGRMGYVLIFQVRS